MSASGSVSAPLGASSKPIRRTEPEPWELVDEALRIFGENAARTLSKHLRVSFEASRTCKERSVCRDDVRERCDRF